MEVDLENRLTRLMGSMSPVLDFPLMASAMLLSK
jgi:hypothetical protein